MEKLGKVFTIAVIAVFTAMTMKSAYSAPAQIENKISSVPSALAASAVVKYDVIGDAFCSGVLVSPSWVLLVGHCVNRYSDRTISHRRDVYLPPFPDGTHPVVEFSDDRPGDDYFIAVDRIVRVDGAGTLTNSLALVHLAHPAPTWVEPLRLYRGDLPSPEERMEIWGFGVGSGDRGIGGVKIVDKFWRDIDQFWALCLKADPSRLRSGDSGGPILINRNGRKEVIGINWNDGCGGCRGADPCGGRAAAAFSISEDGHSNPVSLLLDRLIIEPMGHGADSLDIDNDGKNEIVLYDANSGELRLLGIGEYTRFNVLLQDQVAPGYHFLEVGDFDQDGSKREIVLYKADTGELRSYRFEHTADNNYYLIPTDRWTPFERPLIPLPEMAETPFIASAATSGDFAGVGGTELALIDGQGARILVFNLATGQFLGSTSHPIFGAATTIFASGRFSYHSEDWIAAYTTYPFNTINFFEPTTMARGEIRFELREGAEIRIEGGPSIASHMVAGEYGGDRYDDILVHRSRPGGPGAAYSDRLVTVYTDVGSGSHSTLMNRILERGFIFSPANMIIPGNFDEDAYDEIALWQRAYSHNRQAMSVYSIDGTDSMTRLSGRAWNWENRWWTLMQ